MAQRGGGICPSDVACQWGEQGLEAEPDPKPPQATPGASRVACSCQGRSTPQPPPEKRPDFLTS